MRFTGAFSCFHFAVLVCWNVTVKSKKPNVKFQAHEETTQKIVPGKPKRCLLRFEQRRETKISMFALPMNISTSHTEATPKPNNRFASACGECHGHVEWRGAEKKWNLLRSFWSVLKHGERINGRKIHQVRPSQPSAQRMTWFSHAKKLWSNDHRRNEFESRLRFGWQSLWSWTFDGVKRHGRGAWEMEESTFRDCRDRSLASAQWQLRQTLHSPLAEAAVGVFRS